MRNALQKSCTSDCYIIFIPQLQHLAIMEDSGQEANNKVNFEQQYEIWQGDEVLSLQSYEIQLQRISILAQAMKEPFIESGIVLKEFSSKGRKCLIGVNYSHQSFSVNQGDEQFIKPVQSEEICQQFNPELVEIINQQLKLGLSTEDREACAAQLLKHYQKQRFNYTPEEIQTFDTQASLPLKVRNWKLVDIKKNLRDMAREALCWQLYFIKDIYQSEQMGQRNEFQKEFKEKLYFLRSFYNNENQKIDELLPGEREPIINRFNSLKNLPAKLKTAQRQKYLQTNQIISPIKLEEEVEILIKMQEIEK